VNCATVHELLNEYVEGNLTSSVSQLLSEHLQKCRQCAAEECLLRKLAATLHSLPPKPAPPHFTEEVMEKVSHSGDVSVIEPLLERDAGLLSEGEVGLLSRVVSKSGLQSIWTGMRIVSYSVNFARYVPRPTVRLRTSEDRSRSLTKLPLALGLRW
jgi:hypothetical protein